MNFSPDPLHNLENLQAKNKTHSISIYLVVILVLVGVLACLPIINVDISSQSRGILRAAKENVPISSLVSGKLTYVNAVNNQTVTQGDTLFTISTDNLLAQQLRNDSLLELRMLELKDYKHLISQQFDSLTHPVIIEQYNSYKAKQQELQSRKHQAQITYNRYYHLYKKQVIAKAEYETHLYNLRFAKQALEQLNTQQQNDWETQKQRLEERIQELKVRSVELVFEEDKYTITATSSGTLENVMGLQVGSTINASQVIGTISPNSNLIVENTVLPNDIGLLQEGQKVKFQLDAFNYNQWGMLEGEVIDIDKNITLQDQTAFFKVRCSLYTKELKLKNGYKAQVKKGMTLTTRYFITRRSLYDLLFDKVDDWLNPKLISNR